MTGPFLGCITEAAAKGEIPEDVAQEAAETYQASFDAAAETMGAAEADRVASRRTMDSLEAKEIEARRQRALQVRARKTALNAIADYAERRGYSGIDRWWNDGREPPPGAPVLGAGPPKDGPGSKGGVLARALPLLMRNKWGLSGLPTASVEGRELAIRGGLDALMASVIEKFQAGLDANLLHQRGRATLSNLVREAFGEETGDMAAKDLARAFGEAAERVRQMFNAAGGAIGKMENWGLPQAHNAAKILAAGKEAWLDFTLPLLDRSKMIDRDAGAPFTEKRLRYILGQTYDRIVTRGAIDRDPGKPLGRGKLANTRADERFLAFKDADSWSAYQGQFGDADPFGAMMHHLDSMAKDVALMQVLGPNPEHEFGRLKDMAAREAQLEQRTVGPEAVTRANKNLNLAQDMFDSFTGKANLPEDERLARYAANARSYLTAADLGGVILTDLPSAPFFGAMARSFMGLHGDMGQLFKLMASPEMRGMARRADFINDVARDGLAATTQDSLRMLSVGAKADEGFNSISRRLPTAIMRLQGLAGIFEARKRSFRLSFMGALADAAGKSLDELDAAGGADRMLATELKARGFSEDDWAKIGAAEKWEPKPGATFLRAREIEASAGQDLALRVGEMILNAEQAAVPVSGSLWSRAYLLGGARPGTFKGEALRSLLMFRTFVVNVLHQYGEEVYLRGAAKGYTGANLGAWCGAWGAGVFGMMTLTGMMSLQLKQIAAGKDPMPLNDPRTWGAAMLQGGGLGILGDFLFSEKARNEKSSPVVALGPLGEAIDDARLTATTYPAARAQGKTHSQAWHAESQQLAKDMRSYVPGASLWWARTAFDRMIVERLQDATDPDAKSSFQRSARALQHDTGQQMWWPKGEPMPARAPDMGAMWRSDR